MTLKPLKVGDAVRFTARASYRQESWPEGAWLEAGKLYSAEVVEVREDRYRTSEDDTSFAVIRLENGAQLAVDWPTDPSVTRARELEARQGLPADTEDDDA